MPMKWGHVLLAGVIATMSMDVLTAIAIQLRAIAPLSPNVVGRWFASVARAHPFHEDIARARPGSHELAFAVPGHYAIGMCGELLTAATLGWHGLEGDRRLAFRRLDSHTDFPWLTASTLPDLVLFTPQRRQDANSDALPTHVLTPEREEMAIFEEALAAEIGRRCRHRVEMTQFKHGIFDDATISVITSDTVREICRLAGTDGDVRRFRPNIVVRSTQRIPFEEDDWLGGVLTFGNADDAAAVTVTTRDVRCTMVNLDPDGGRPSPELLKAVVSANQNNAGVYATVTHIGQLAVDRPSFFVGNN